MSKFKFVWQYLSTTLPVFKKALDNTKVYRAFLTQIDGNAPVATVIENSLGADITFEYDDTGIYYAYTSTSFFNSVSTTIDGKPVEISITPSSSESGVPGDVVTLTAYPVFYFVIQISSLLNGVRADSQIGNYGAAMLEIKVYDK